MHFISGHTAQHRDRSLRRLGAIAAYDFAFQELHGPGRPGLDGCWLWRVVGVILIPISRCGGLRRRGRV